MLLHLSTWKEIETYLERSTAIIVPIGSTEQHGPTGLIGTDTICPEKIAQAISDQHNVLIGPTINIGMSQHHLAFPGSITLKPSTLMAVVKDVVNSLVLHGFTHIFFLNGHGGNIGPANTAFSEIYSDYTFKSLKCPVHCAIQGWYEGKRVEKVSDTYFKGVEGHHATPSEVSLSYAVYPKLLKTSELDPEVAPMGSFRDALDYRKTFPDGRIGSNPSLASVEVGEEICQAAVEDLMECFTKFIENGK